jgi:hypothetical protein
MTFYVLETAPSVSRNICLGYPSITLEFKMFFKGYYISVPPKFASILSIYLMALEIFYVLFFIEEGNRF